MEAIDQVPFNFDPRIGLIVGIMVGFLVFAVALDLTWEQLRRVLKSPKAPAIGLLAQFGILPAVAFGAGVYLTDVRSHLGFCWSRAARAEPCRTISPE